MHHKEAAQSWLDSGALGKLRDDHDTFRNELLELKQQHESSLHDLAVIRERLRVAETKQKQMAVFMIKSLKNPLFLQSFVDRMKQRRLTTDSIKTVDLDEIVNVESQEELIIESGIQPLPSDDSGSSPQESTNGLTENLVLWEKLMEDDMIYVEGQEAATKQHAVLVSELENLIANPATGVVELLGFPASTCS